MKLLIDECLHTSLVEAGHATGYVADHVNYLGLGSSKDWQLMATIRAQDYGMNPCSETNSTGVVAVPLGTRLPGLCAKLPGR